MEIGTKEAERLSAEPVVIAGARIEAVKNKEGKEVGDKVICTCKHPSQEDMIDISKVKYLKNEKIVEHALWFNKEKSEDKIVKNSALAFFMVHVGASTVSELEGKKIETTQDKEGYLCFKAY